MSVSEDEETSSTLLSRARLNESEAWEKIVQLYSPLIFRWCRLSGLSATDTDSVGRNVFLAVGQGLADFRHSGPKRSFREWLRFVTREKITDFVQRTEQDRAGAAENIRLHTVLQDDDESEETTREESRLLHDQAIASIRNEFSEQDWQAFFRSVANAESPRSIAADLGVSVTNVYLARSRIRKRLRLYFSDLIDEKYHS